MGNQQVNIENLKDFVVCPICNKKFKSITNRHLKYTHNISVEEFRNKFPSVCLESEAVVYKRSQSGIKAWNDSTKRANILNGLQSEEAYKKMSEKGLSNWSNKELRDKRVQTMKQVANTPEAKKRASEVSKRTWSNKEYREKIIKGIRYATSKEEYRKKQSIKSKNMWKDPEHPKRVLEGYKSSKKKFPFTFKNGKVLQTRSSYEVRTCKYLEVLGISFEYEKYRFDYYLKESYPGYTKGFHSYYPDFYIPDMDLFLEVKPEGLDKYIVNQIKVKSVLDSGKRIYFVKEKELKSIKSFREFINNVYPNDYPIGREIRQQE